MRTATAVIAIYAASVASASLAWQIYTWWHRRQSRVEVGVSMAVAAPAAGVTLQALSVTATNRSEHAVRITGVGVDLQDDGGMQFHQVIPIHGATIPGPIQPHDSGNALLMREDVEREGLDVYKPVTAWVRLATGETVKSPPTTVLRQG
jgi:hypothetical protein